MRGVIKPAFRMAYDVDAVRKNPFVFKLTDAVVNDSVSRVALTEERLKTWINFIKNDRTYSKYFEITTPFITPLNGVIAEIYGDL